MVRIMKNSLIICFGVLFFGLFSCPCASAGGTEEMLEKHASAQARARELRSHVRDENESRMPEAEKTAFRAHRNTVEKIEERNDEKSLENMGRAYLTGEPVYNEWDRSTPDFPDHGFEFAAVVSSETKNSNTKNSKLSMSDLGKMLGQLDQKADDFRKKLPEGSCGRLDIGLGITGLIPHYIQVSGAEPSVVNKYKDMIEYPLNTSDNSPMGHSPLNGVESAGMNQIHPILQRANQWGIPFIPEDMAKKYGYAP